MSFPQRIPNPVRVFVSTEAICDLAERWGISFDLAYRLTTAAGELPFDLWIFSGARTPDEQSGLQSIDFNISTHADRDARGCPREATGADVQPISIGVRESPMAVAQMGAAFVRAGLRWGGGAPVDDTGIPIGNERWHVDLGPRSETE